MDVDRASSADDKGRWQRRLALVGRRAGLLDPTLKGLLWASAAGFVFSMLNSVMRTLTLQLDPFQAQFLRYFFGLVVLLPLVLRHGLRAYRPRAIGGQFARGAVHTLGLCLWFVALPKIPLADMTAIGFTAPIFIMLGAHFFFKESMRWERWLAAIVGFAGVLIVVAPKLQGSGGFYNLVMLASAPMFAASFLITKALTRYETTGVILVWQAITVTLFSIPLALLHWKAPTLAQWIGFLLCGFLGSLGALLPDALVPHCRHLGHPIGEVPRPAVGRAAGLAGIRRRARPVDADRRRRDLCLDDLDRAPRVARCLPDAALAARRSRPRGMLFARDALCGAPATWRHIPCT